MARRRKKNEELPPTPPDIHVELDYINPDLRQLATAIGTLTLDPENVKMHDERNVATVEASLKQYGQWKPIVVQKSRMRVMIGNCTVTAAKRLGWTHIAANIVDCDDQAAAAMALVDNRSSELGDWDFEGIASIVAKYQLDPAEFALGFSTEEMAAIVSSKPWVEADPDENEEESNEAAAQNEDRAVAAIIKVKVVDLPYREKVQKAIAKLLNSEELKGLARLL